jgi:asparagine synthetase B (glutamine-hydrolysing)
MSGVAGLVVYGEAEPVRDREVRVLPDAQRYRGPDDERGETLRARDPLGIKPLYPADDGRRLV